MRRKKLEELNLLDDFLFGCMVTYPEIGEKFCRLLIGIITGKQVDNVKVIPQKVYYGGETDRHGITERKLTGKDWESERVTVN